MTLDEFLSHPVANNCSDEELALWASRSFKEQMQDIYGEAARLIKYHRESKEKVAKQWEVFDLFCSMTYLAPTTTKGERETLKLAQWELYDYVFGKNDFRNSSESVMRWFNQWIFDINYAAISEG